MDDASKSATTAKLQPGEYIVEVSKKGYDTYKTTVNVNGDQTIEATLIESIKTGAAATVENSLVEYKNTVLVNDNAIVTVVVKDKDGNLVPGKTVVFSANNHIQSDARDKDKALVVKGSNVTATDANGRASFVVGFENPTKDSTDSKKVASADYTAKVLDITDGTDSIVSGSVGFAALDLEGVSVNSSTKLERGENAEDAKADATSNTYSLNEDTTPNVTYVSAQKVSTTNNNEHEVTFNSKPKIVLPAMASEDKKAEEFVQPVNYKSGDYFTYADGKYDKIIVLEEEASQLKYATLMFNDIKISKHTRLIIDSYKDKECEEKNRIKDASKIIDGEHSQKGFGYQLPLTEGVKAVKVSIDSAGQVQTDMNSGYDIDKIVGVYKNDNSIDGKSEIISSATVKWENVNPTMSDFVKLTGNAAREFADAHNISFDQTKGGSLDYQVPVFPYTGDAVIREFDSNDKIVNYYLAPTVKVTSGTDHNTNIIAPGATAYKATEEEATNHAVGSVSAEGNGINVKVNSAKVGSTNLKGTISLPSLGGDALDASNKYIYTSVQWNPIPKDAAVSTSDAFLALSGQNINVYAQLIDKNGNPVSLKDQTITYKYREEKANGDLITLNSNNTTVKSLNKDIAVVKNTNTDVNGKATLTLNSAQANVLDDLQATSPNYDVILYIGKDKASIADLYWVNPDLAFKKDVKSAYVVTDNSEKTVETNKSNASTPWQYAVKAVGNKFIPTTDAAITANEKPFSQPGTLANYDIDIKGLNINTTFNEDNKGTYKVSGNGVVDGTSSREYKDIITNEFDKKSVVTGITFDLRKDGTTKTYSCVGEGTPNFNAKMILNVSWEAKGTKLAITSPVGTTVSDKGVGNDISAYNDGAAAELYVKVTDATGNNPKAGQIVTFKSGAENDTFAAYDPDKGDYGVQGSTNTVEAKTDGNGVARVKLILKGDKATSAQKSSVITASVEGADQVATTTINWVDYEKAFGIVNAGVTKENDKQIKLTFNNEIEADSLKKDMFDVKNSGIGENKDKKYDITNVTSSGRYVYLTLKSALPADKYTVTIKPTTIDSVEYTLCDKKGVKLGDSVEKEFYSEKTASFNVSYPTYPTAEPDVATIMIDGIKTGIAKKVGNTTDAAGAKVAGKKAAETEFKNRFVVAVDGKIQNIVLKNQDSSGNDIADLKVGENVLVEEKTELIAGTETIEDASFTLKLRQENKDQKVEIFYLGGSETRTVKAADQIALDTYIVDKAGKKVTLKLNRNVSFVGTNDMNTIKSAIKTTTGAAIGKSVNLNNNEIEIEFTNFEQWTQADANNVSIVIPAGTLEDKNSGANYKGYTNKLISFTGIDITAPTVLPSAKQATDLAKNGKTFQIKFSEAMDKASVEKTSNWKIDSNLSSGIKISYDEKTQIATFTLNTSSAVTSDNTIVPKDSITDIHGNKLDVTTNGVGKTITIVTGADGNITSAAINDVTV